MSVSEDRELVIVGGGPAGMAAAIEARRAGVSTALIDERPSLGGQIYKQFPRGFKVRGSLETGAADRAGRELIECTASNGTELLLNTVVWSISDGKVYFYREDGQSGVLVPRCVILATGAYDRPVPFPGWTLPGVVTAGAAQSLIKTQQVLPGRRILMAGSGPLLLAFAAELHQRGANIVAAIEAAPSPGLGAVAVLLGAAPGNVRLLWTGMRYMAYLRRQRVPLLYSHMVVRAEGQNQVERAIIARVDPAWRVINDTERVLDVDTVCLGYGLFPSNELARTCGCELRYSENEGGYLSVRDQYMRTSVPGILAVGDGAAVAGSLVAIEEGRLAGIGAALDLGRLNEPEAHRRAAAIRRRLRTLGRFRSALNSMYPVGPGIYELATPDTVICRCEEVTASEVLANVLAGSTDPNTVKSLTRAGMGLCQGRNCARQVASIVARQAGLAISAVPPLSSRAPVKPVPISAIAKERPEMEPSVESLR